MGYWIGFFVYGYLVVLTQKLGTFIYSRRTVLFIEKSILNLVTFWHVKLISYECIHVAMWFYFMKKNIIAQKFNRKAAASLFIT